MQYTLHTKLGKHHTSNCTLHTKKYIYILNTAHYTFFISHCSLDTVQYKLQGTVTPAELIYTRQDIWKIERSVLFSKYNLASRVKVM